MLQARGKKWIEKIRIRIIFLYWLRILLVSSGVSIALWSLMVYVDLNSVWLLGSIFSISIILQLADKRTWQISLNDVARHLNERFLELEESAQLFLKSENELSLLQKFQVEKISRVVPLHYSFRKQLSAVLYGMVLIIVAIGVNVYLPVMILKNAVDPLVNGIKHYKEKRLPEVERISVHISPPTYTKRAKRLQNQFSIKAELGSAISWKIKTTSLVNKMRLIFNDKEVLDLNSAKQFVKVIGQSGFYQLELDGKRSDLYPIEVIPDLPVKIKIINPKPHTTIDVGQVPKVKLSALLQDDYEIDNAHISATLSSGKGEGVSFTEKKITFEADFKSKKSLVLNKILDLTSLGMKPGDELYFFIEATDSRGQASRSDVYLISISDPAELMSMAGMTNGVDLVPEYFRSQRQIIIDTEKLLKERGTIGEDEFKNRSNTLGMDQKLLRLRYGKFLGEESESGTGGDHDHEEGEEHEEIAFGDVKALMDQYAHKHDIAEDATFFEPALKAQLKAVLNEMWSSELRLRTYKPIDALPFEYKALRLLKDLQQKSRAYVAKTTIKKAKLKMEKRLTGDLDQVEAPTQQRSFEGNDTNNEELRLLLAVLEKRKEGKSFAFGDRELLRAGEKQFIAAAVNHPSSFLGPLKSLRKLSTSTTVSKGDVSTVQKAIIQLLRGEEPIPQVTPSAPGESLYDSYFKRLKHGF